MKTIQPGVTGKAPSDSGPNSNNPKKRQSRASIDLPDGLRPLAVRFKTARALIGVGKTKFHELINDGKIKTVTIDGVRLAVYSSLERLVKEAA